MSDRLRAGKPSWYVTSHLVNSAFHPSGVCQSSTGLSGIKAGCVHLCHVAGNTVWSHMASDIPYLCRGVPSINSYTVPLLFFSVLCVWL